MPDHPAPTQPPTPPQTMEAAFRSPVMRIYANGFSVGLTPTDIAIVLHSNGAPTAILNVSYEGAKTLSEELAKTLNLIGDAIGPIKTAPEVMQAIEKVTANARNK